MSAQPVEYWRPVVRWEGLYEVSTRGRIRSLDRKCRHKEIGSTRIRKGVVLKLRNRPTRNGYPSALLREKQAKRSENLYAHRAVGEAFIPGVGRIVRHLDGGRDNAAIENLAWGSYSDNIEDSRRHGTLPMGEQNANSVLTERQVRLILSSSESGVCLGTKLGVSPSHVCSIRRGKAWKHISRLEYRVAPDGKGANSSHSETQEEPG